MSNKTPLTLDTLRTAFHLPRELAAEQLQVTVNELKKSLKNLGVGRWPYRKIASLQALQHDLDQQIHAFRAFGSADGPAMSHVQDLQDMHAKISQDIAKIVEDPNVPLDESLHKLRLQNYKARFLGRHGMTSHLPMLKLPTAPIQTPAAKVSSPTIATSSAAEQGVSQPDPAGLSQSMQVGGVMASHSSSSAAVARPCRSTSTGQAADSRDAVEPDAATAMASAGNRPRRTASLLGPQDGAACQLGAGLASSSSLQLPQALLLKRSACELPAEAGAGSASQLGLARNSRSRTLSWATSAGLEAAPPSRTQSGTLGPTLGIGQAGQVVGSAGAQAAFNMTGAAQLASSGGSASGELGLWSSDSAARSWAWAQHSAGGSPACHYHAQMSLAAMPTLPEHEELQAAAPPMRAAASAPLYSESRPSGWRVQEHAGARPAQQQQQQQPWQGRAYHPPGPDRHLAGSALGWGPPAVRPPSAAAVELGGFLMEAYELQPVVDLPDMVSYADADRWQQEVQAAQARAAVQAHDRGQAQAAVGRQFAYPSSAATWSARGPSQQQTPQASQHWVHQHHSQQWQRQQASAQQGQQALQPHQPSTSLLSSQLRVQQQQPVCKVEDMEGLPEGGTSGSWVAHHHPATGPAPQGVTAHQAAQYLAQPQTRQATVGLAPQPLGSAPPLVGPPPTWPSWTVPDLEAHKLPMHTLRPPAPRQAPSLEPLPTPLEEVLDQMVVTQQAPGPAQGLHPPGPAAARHSAWSAGSSSAQQLGPPPGSSWAALGYAGLRQPAGSASAEQSRQLANQELHPYHTASVTHQFASTGQLVSCSAAVIGGASSSQHPSSQHLLLSAPDAVAEQAAGPLPEAWVGSEGWGAVPCPDARPAWGLPPGPPAAGSRPQPSRGQRQSWSLQPQPSGPHSPGQLAGGPAGGSQLGPGAWQTAGGAAPGPHAAHMRHWGQQQGGQQWHQLAGTSGALPAETVYLEQAGPGPAAWQPPAEVPGAEVQVRGQPGGVLPGPLPGELGGLSPATPSNQQGQLQLAALGLSGGCEQGSGSGGRGAVEGCGREEYLDLSGLWD
ncbi:hypothetical protein QJQ45_015276 [Haematococcus lacustris]|nr:hypothetical protein QJQ45_015276 [Haematococcus lacustris]